jgi:hypothetical protein
VQETTYRPALLEAPFAPTHRLRPSGEVLGDYRTAVFILEPWKIWLMKS